MSPSSNGLRQMGEFLKGGIGSLFEQISMQRLTGVPSPKSWGTGWWRLAGREFVWVGGLALDLTSDQAIHAGFDQRTVYVGKTVGKNE